MGREKWEEVTKNTEKNTNLHYKMKNIEDLMYNMVTIFEKTGFVAKRVELF